jgi:hypothetical protein
LRHVIPEGFVAARPEEPGITPFNLFRRERRSVIHALENVPGNLRVIFNGLAARFGFVWVLLLNVACAAAGSDKYEQQRDSEDDEDDALDEYEDGPSSALIHLKTSRKVMAVCFLWTPILHALRKVRVARRGNL